MHDARFLIAGSTEAPRGGGGNTRHLPISDGIDRPGIAAGDGGKGRTVQNRQPPVLVVGLEVSDGASPAARQSRGGSGVPPSPPSGQLLCQPASAQLPPLAAQK